jgi:hypothetical protein
MICASDPSSCGNNLYGFDDVAHEAAIVPIWRIGLDLAVCIGATDHQRVRTRLNKREICFPLTKAVFAMVNSEPGELP